MTLDDALLLTVGRDMWSTNAVGDVPSLKMADGPMGIASGRVDERDISVLTPSGISLAATWDRDLVTKVGALVGGEAKAQNVDCVLAPNLNLQRSPLGGRAFEMLGEDPLLAGTLGCSWIRGLQSRRVGAVAKHLVCNDSETARDSFDATIDEASLREAYLLPFEMAARAECAGIMTAYNKLNGVHCSQNHFLLTTVLCEDWRYDGFTVCDWFGTHSPGAMHAGLDLEMPGPPRHFGEKLRAAIEAGTVPESYIMAAARRVAKQARRFAGGDAGDAPGSRDEILTDAAASSFVLLRNDDRMLPILPGSLETIAIIGPNAAAPCFQGGTFAKIALRRDAILPVEALQARYGVGTIRFAPGCDPAPRLPAMPAIPLRDLGDGCTRGLTVDYFASHDFTQPPAGSETRDTNSLTWFGGMPGISSFAKPGGVRASGLVTPQVSGVHRLYIGGTGCVRLLVDGQEVLSDRRHVAPSDIMGVLKAGDSETVDIELIANSPIKIEAELRFEQGRAQGLWFGLRAPGDALALLEEAEALAREADAVLLVLGETSDSGVESRDRETTALPVDQQQLARRVIAANPNTVLAVNVAHAFDPGIAEGARAFVVVWYPGEAFGPALADVLSGRREPSGRMPVTVARREADYPAFRTVPQADGRLAYDEGALIGHRSFSKRQIRPAFAFGEGLGYGQIEYSGATATRCDDGGAIVTVTARNIGDQPSAAVPQVYRDDGALAGFSKRALVPGEEADILIEIDPIALRKWTKVGWKRYEGSLKVGTSASALLFTVDMEQSVKKNLEYPSD